MVLHAERAWQIMCRATLVRAHTRCTMDHAPFMGLPIRDHGESCFVSRLRAHTTAPWRSRADRARQSTCRVTRVRARTRCTMDHAPSYSWGCPFQERCAKRTSRLMHRASGKHVMGTQSVRHNAVAEHSWCESHATHAERAIMSNGTYLLGRYVAQVEQAPFERQPRRRKV